MDDRKAADLTLSLNAARGGDADARRKAFELLYSELRKIAAARLPSGVPADSLSATILVSDLYERCFASQGQGWVDRKHFFCWAGKAMRSLIIDHIRKRSRLKRKARGHRIALDAIVDRYEASVPPDIDLDRELERLQRIDPRMVEVIHQRFFLGRSVEETAETLELSVRVTERLWNWARKLLRERL